MNEKILIILLALMGGIFPILLNLYKRKSANNPIPENVSDVYDEETYTKWRSYQADHSRLQLVSSVCSLLVNIVLLLTNVYSAFASLFPSEGFIWTAFAVILLDTFVSEIVGLGFSYYSTFVIEENYGFNKSTKKTFVIDKIRGFIINLILMMFLSMLLALLHHGSEQNYQRVTEPGM